MVSIFPAMWLINGVVQLITEKRNEYQYLNYFHGKIKFTVVLSLKCLYLILHQK